MSMGRGRVKFLFYAYGEEEGGSNDEGLISPAGQAPPIAGAA